MKIKVSDATGAALDWLVAKATEPYNDFYTSIVISDIDRNDGQKMYAPSTDWSQGGPIIDREKITASPEGVVWIAVATRPEDSCVMYGPTLLIAVMRCFVVSKLGDEVEVPEELT